MTPSVAFRVRCFASWGEVLGPEVDVELPDGASVGQLLETLTTLAGQRSVSPLPRPAIAVNRRYAKPDTVLHPGDELALIPPVAGG